MSKFKVVSVPNKTPTRPCCGTSYDQCHRENCRVSVKALNRHKAGRKVPSQVLDTLPDDVLVAMSDA